MVQLVADAGFVNVISGYAPQGGCLDEDKNEFLAQLEVLVQSVHRDDKLIVAADLNGHVGENRDGFHQQHGGGGYGMCNAEGTRILDMTQALELIIINTWFMKKEK